MSLYYCYRMTRNLYVKFVQEGTERSGLNSYDCILFSQQEELNQNLLSI